MVGYLKPSNLRWSFQSTGSARNCFRYFKLKCVGCVPLNTALTISGAKNARCSNRVTCDGSTCSIVAISLMLLTFPAVNNTIHELTSFPSAKFDDQVDAISQGLTYLREHLDEPGIITYFRQEVERLRLGMS